MAAMRNQGSTNRRGCYVIGWIVLIVVVLLAAIGLGLLGDLGPGQDQLGSHHLITGD